MATALVQAFNAQGVANPTLATAGITTTSGHALAIAAITYNGGGEGAASFVDNKGNTLSLLAGPISSGTNQSNLYVYTANNITGGSGHTFTLTVNVGGAAAAIIGGEISGQSLGTLVRAFSSAFNTSGQQTHAGATVAAGSGDIVIALSADNPRATDSFTAGLGLTIPANGTVTANQPAMLQYVANVAAGNVTGAYTTTQFTAWSQVIMALLAPSSAGTHQQMLMGLG
jgi:hypothetical protein